MASWVGRVFGAKPDREEPITLETIVMSEPRRAPPGRDTLDAVGKQSEQVRERVSVLAARLEEIKTLADDFGQIVQPVNDFVVRHAHSQSRLLEMEALLARERELSAAARSELNELHATASKAADELGAATVELRARETAGRDIEAQLGQVRLRADDQGVQIHNLERELDAATERARALSDDNQALRVEIEGLDQFRSRAEAELAEAREQNAAALGENGRLQQVTENQAQRITALKSQVLDLEPQIQAGRQELMGLQSRLASEQAARLKVEATRESERVALEGEVSSLRMKIEGLNAHVATTDKMLINLRDQLRDRTEGLRVSEKTLKEAVAEKLASERRTELAQDANARHLAQVAETQRAAQEFKDRAEMLAKALSAKEVALDSGARKIMNLDLRIEQMNARFEQERSAFETANRRLIEELQSERAERSLAQGALDIARNSRTKLLTQFTALKRQQGGAGLRVEDAGLDADEPAREGTDNVHPFKGAERGDEPR